MSFFLIVKLLVVVGFLVMFLRGSRLVWGIGLLTVTTAFLLDAFLGTFGTENVQGELGFFFYIVTGGLFAGAAVWLFGLLRPLSGADGGAVLPAFTSLDTPAPRVLPRNDPYAGTAFDRRMLYDQIRYRFGPDDVLDLIFDLRLNENDMIQPAQPVSEAIVHIMDAAEESNLTTELALSVERVLTPPPADHLPRLEKLSAESPPTVLRHFLLANYDNTQLRRMADILDIDWEQLSTSSKKEFVRNFLLHLDRRNRTGDLLTLMQEQPLID